MRAQEYSLLKRIRIRSRRRMNSLFVGEYRSAFKGTGLNFESVREYQYGDEVRNIDWNVSARMRTLFIKEFIEERELSIVLMVDLSGSVEFGTGRSKRDIIMEVVTLLLYLAQMNNDRVSVLIFTDTVERYMKPKKGRKFLLSVLNEILSFKPAGRRTDICGAIDFLERVLKKRSVVFLVSDFLADDCAMRLRRLARRHDVIPVVISDPMEREMRLFGLAEFVDLETGRVFLSDAVPGRNGAQMLQGFDSITLSTAEPVDLAMLKFFEQRNRVRMAGI